ncbi:rab-GTPase-TBC domain-containing protein [Scheffersomyces amazonensis]|uniref:rab-GTPase-TBC domain-containing protein n=1 Tax=Scheffersomyces amazonensis TaxID=1078765 RepID=UPI00315DE307
MSQFLDPTLEVSTPKQSGHKRTESSYSTSYSVLDIYETESPISARSPTTTNNELGDEIMRGLDELEFKDLSNDNTLFASNGSETEINSNSNLNLNLNLNSNSYIEERIEYITPINNITNIKTILSSPYDMYGFKKKSNLSSITPEHYNQWFEQYSQYLLERKQKWLSLMRTNGLNLPNDSTIPTRFPPKSAKVKKLIRKGIPPEWRGNAWFYYAGGYEKLSKHNGLYKEIATNGVKNKDSDVIERDLDRTFPDNKYFKSNDNNEPKMIQSLRRVLTAFAHYKPQIGYCQSLNFLAGLLLLFMNEERSFWMLVILTERIIPNVHSHNLEGVHTDQGVLMLCIKEYINQLWPILGKSFDGQLIAEDKILSNLPPIALVTSPWFMSLFVGVLPIESTLRIWDILWYQGSKTIFRIGLTLFKMSSETNEFQELTSTNSSQNDQVELYQFMQSYPKSLLDPNEVLGNCFKKIGGYGYGSLSQAEIDTCREFVSKQREKLNNKKKNTSIAVTDEERQTLLLGQDVHDVYGFHRSIMILQIK